MRRNRCLSALAFVVCLAGLALAQNTNSADIRGTVTDASGAVIQGVNVTVTNNETGVVNKFVTNSEGLYDTNSILPGNYTVEFSKEGFTTLKRGPIPLQVGIATVDGNLKVGSTTEAIEVRSTAPLLKTEDAQVSTTLTTRQLADLPSVDPANGWTSLMKWLPGATSTPGGAMNGGGGGGNVFNLISKNGTNQYHGALYEYFQNDALNARDYFNNASHNSPVKAKQRYNYFGGAFGGPIVKSK